MNKKIKRGLALSFAFVLSFNSLVFGAQRFKDVPKNHWAHDAVVRIADRGLIVGTPEGEYKPNNPIDKFDTSRVLAVAAGYKYSNLTDEEKTFYENAYDKNSGIINNYKNTFTKWKSNADKEIAFLIEKGVLEESDLSQFVIRNGDKENLRALSRQEFSVFLVRLMGKSNEANNQIAINKFKDDEKIQTKYRPSVYYLRSIGVVNGDENNNFNPNGAVSRAAMAVMLDATLKIMDGETKVIDSGNTQTGQNQIETIQGSIEKVHTNLNALQIKYLDGSIKIHKLNEPANIYVNGDIKTIYDLEEGMNIEAVSKNGTINNIKATSGQAVIDKEIPKETPSETPKETTPESTRTISGTVVDIYKEDNNTGKISIEIKIIDPFGGVIKEIKDVDVDSKTDIKRSGKDIDLSNIIKNDIVRAKVQGNRANSLELEEKNRHFLGTVVNKRTDAGTGLNYFEVEDSSENIHELYMDGDTRLTRKGKGNVKFNDIRIGDSIDLISEYAYIKEAYAYGSQGFVEGIVREINVSRDDTYLLLEHDNKVEKYYIIEGSFDIYTLRLNSTVRLRLDSKEVEAVTLLSDDRVDYYTGYIEDIQPKYMLVKPSINSTNTRKVYFDSYTIITDSVNGIKVNAGSLYRNMKVYITYTSSTSDKAKSITILSK